MLPIKPLPRLAPMLLLPTMLCAGCAHDLPLSRPAPAPSIPPLPAQARQVDSPTYSTNAQRDIQKWQQQLIEPSSPVRPASAPTNP